MVVLLSLASFVYCKLVFQTPLHSVPPGDTPAPDKSTPFECADEQGNLATCKKGGCNGRLKPPRTHHCSTCGVCREGFDHHVSMPASLESGAHSKIQCPWIGTCVTTRNRPQFLTFLLLTVIALTTAVSPIMVPVWGHTKMAYQASKTDPWIVSHWWDRSYSWILFGGPPGRFVGAALLGFGALKRNGGESGNQTRVLGTMVSEPNMVMLLTVMATLLFTLFCGVGTCRETPIHSS